MVREDRLFVPLNKEAYGWYKNLGKSVELRSYYRKDGSISPYNENTVRKGRRAELRLGYSANENIWGIIGNVFIGTLEYIFSQVCYKRIAPNANSNEEAIEKTKEIIGDRKKYIAFEIISEGKT